MAIFNSYVSLPEGICEFWLFDVLTVEICWSYGEILGWLKFNMQSQQVALTWH